MNDLIINLFKYFSKFVPKEVLGSIFIQPDRSKKTGYDEIMTEVLSYPNDWVIQGFDTFVVSINKNYLSERVKNSNAFILYVEYGDFEYDNEVEKGVKEVLMITVAHDISNKNNDNLNEIILMNQCFNLLTRIIQTMRDDQGQLDFCANAELITYPVEIVAVDPVKFYDRGGWCAMFINANTIV
jgi:hypothetical protein